jgi:hypothetical protein
MIFTPDDVRTRLREQPFTPVQLVTTTGQTYDIYHPDMVLVASHFLIVGTPNKVNPAYADQVTRLALVHLAELRDLPPANASTNGPTST